MSHHRQHAVRLACILMMIMLPLTVQALPARQEITPQPEVTETLPVEQPTDAPLPTETATELPPATDVPTETPLPTETSTDVPTETPLPTETPTETPTELPTETVIPTETPLPTEAPTDIPTEEPALPPQLVIDQTCTTDGIVFVISNQGGPMLEPSTFMLALDGQTVAPPTTQIIAPVEPDQPGDDGAAPMGEGVDQPAEVVLEVAPIEGAIDPAASDSAVDTDAPAADDAAAQDGDAAVTEGDQPADVQPEPEPEPAPVEVTPDPILPVQVWPNAFTFAPGESLTLAGGFGRPTLYVDALVSQPAEPCYNPPVLSASAVCTFETGVIFTISNSGGPMLSNSMMSVIPNDTITPGAQPALYDLLLAAGETITVAGGYGQPTLVGDSFSAALDAPCWAPSEVHGLVWEDSNGDGAYSDGDVGLANVTVVLLDDAGMTIATVTSADGFYSFPMLPTGSYTFQVDLASVSADHVALTDAAQRVDVLQGLTHEANFGFSVSATAEISGSVWLENVNWGVRDAEDFLIPTAQVELIDAAGAIVATLPVDAQTGGYTFTGLRAGDYIVRLIESSLFAPYGITYNADSDVNLETPVTLTHGQAVSGVDFGVVGTY